MLEFSNLFTKNQDFLARIMYLGRAPLARASAARAVLLLRGFFGKNPMLLSPRTLRPNPVGHWGPGRGLARGRGLACGAGARDVRGWRAGRAGLARPYGIPMESLWNPYGILMESL